MHGPHVQRHIHDGAIEPVAAVENLPMGNRRLFTMIGGKYPNDHEINPDQQPQLLEFLNHHESTDIETL
jgi:hypothetical protein